MACRLVTLLCSLLIALGACADDWVLTGLARTGGQVRVYLTASAGGTFVTLRPGEETGGWRLAAINFRERCVWLASSSQTNRVEFAASPAPAVRQDAEPRTQPTYSSQAFTGLEDGQNPTAGMEPAMPVAGDAPAQPGVAGTGPDSPGAASPDTDSISATPPGPRRPATADELFKSRNGYGAWEDLLRRRQQAKALGLSLPEP